MSQITTHILDIATGKPARNVPIALHMLHGEDWLEVASGITNEDGRIPTLCEKQSLLAAGTYRIRFDTAAYFTATGDPVFYPRVEVVFNIEGDGQHYHIPLLLSPFGYSTYRGS